MRAILTTIATALFLALSITNAFAAAYTSTTSGDWNNVATWGGGGYPQSSADSATIANTHTVTYNVNAVSTNCGAITINSGGTLSFSAIMTTSLIMQGNLTVSNGGKLYVGTDATPIGADYTATIQIVCTSGGQYGLTTADGATVEMTGSSSYHLANGDYTQASLAADIAAGATSLTTDVSTGWKSGDVLTIATSAYVVAQTEKVTLSADATGTTVPITATTYAHTSGALICHYSRNVKIKSQNPTYPAYVYFTGSTSSIDCSYVEFTDLGYNASSKYGVELYNLRSANLDHCAIYDYEKYGLFTYLCRDTTLDHVNFFGINTSSSYLPIYHTYSVRDVWSYVNSGYSYGTYWHAVTNATVSNSHFYSTSYGIYAYGGSNNNTFTNCKFYCNTTYGYIFMGDENFFENCTFGSPVANNIDVRPYGYRSGRIILRNCLLASSTEVYNFSGQYNYVKSQDHDQTTGYHKSWYDHGEIERSGQGMPDITKRTGDYALRAYSYSTASSSPYLTFQLHFGVESAQTPTVSCYFKRNSASADKPAITLSGCGLSGETEYTGTSIDWTQLSQASATAATSTGVATATITLNAGGSGSSYYVYFDDFTVSGASSTTTSIDTGDFEYWFEGSTSPEVYEAGGLPGMSRTMRHGNFFKNLVEQWFTWAD